ncbi:gamma-tubulin complex DGRIP91/SPC98 component [Pluteus cervinus]|uniref:Gamma-tubulin complex DGRIP91/SPC98 component n=1 Tax=Pluteus cervinus TaxID=181527 RepID=A0ACD3BCW7_9AGAR|nr:gamma-tubulin complex DGRIP91/SPC98 component [Pluteus cervinus]
MSTHSAHLEDLITSLVPESRRDAALKQELLAHCQEILSSHIGHAQYNDSSLSLVSDAIKRQLLQLSPNGTAALEFTNLLSRLVEEPVLTRKNAAILFLQALSSSAPQASNSAGIIPAILPPPPPIRRVSNLAKSPTPINNSVPTGKSKAALLRDYRARLGRPHLPELLLLRDTLYLLQGISGKYVQLSVEKEVSGVGRLAYVEDSNYTVPTPTKALLHKLAEVGYLYARVEAYVRERESAKGVGMIEQSLCHHLQSQLTEYYRLIAVLESQMSSDSTRVPLHGRDSEEGPQGQSEGETGLTLRRLDVWVNEWRLRLRMMSVCVEGARETHGGALVNLIHGYTDNGDPFVRRFTDQLLEEVSKPFFATLHKWLFSGELYDPFLEFFVAVDVSMAHLHYVHPSALSGGIFSPPSDGAFAGLGGDVDDISGIRESGLRLWENKYRFQKEMLPMFVGEAFGRKIFSTGKSLNFIRYSCHDSDWVATREKMSNTGGALKYSDIHGLERSIDAAYQIASQRLFEIFIDKFKLLDHLHALKNYLMLGHGDFAEQLMEALSPSLSKPANALYRHNLTATLETAIRTSNAQNDPADVLRRLDARMLEYSHGEIGWDVFTLEYKLDAPIDTVLDPDSIQKYLKVFRHLWNMKRIEVALNQGWMKLAGGARTLRVPDLEYSWHKLRLTMSEMIHFMRQLQAYCHLEVIECSWKIFMEFLNKKEGDLDAMIGAHKSYLDRIVKKILLISSKSRKEEVALNEVRELFSVILNFTATADDFFGYCLAESARRDQERDVDRGVYTGEVGHVPQLQKQTNLLDRLDAHRQQFAEKVQQLVSHLQSHDDLDCRFLAIRLSFSEFYKSRKDHSSKNT